jgi:hypothetical protein
MSPLGIHLLNPTLKSNRITIASKQSVRFVLGEIVRTEPTEFGSAIPIILESEEALWQEYIKAEQYHMFGLIIPYDNGRQPLLRNDGTILTLAIYGEEVRPAYAVLRLDMRDEIRVTLWQTRRELTEWPIPRDIIRTTHELD